MEREFVQKEPIRFARSLLNKLYQPQIPVMARSGGKGSIIVNSSMAGTRVCDVGNEAHTGVYAASEAGVGMLMKYAAIEASTLVCDCAIKVIGRVHLLISEQADEGSV